MTQMIERGGIEHLRAVVEEHQNTLRFLHGEAREVRKWIDAGDLEMAKMGLEVIETKTRGYGGSGER